MPSEVEQHEYVNTSSITLSTETDLDMIPSLYPPPLHSNIESESASLPESQPHHDPITQDDSDWSAEMRAFEDDVPPMLRLLQIASNEIHCQRLHENWDGINFDLAKLINFEKGLWAQSGLKRLNDPMLKGEKLCGGTGSPVNGADATNVIEDGENLYICEDGGMSCSPFEFLVHEMRFGDSN